MLESYIERWLTEEVKSAGGLSVKLAPTLAGLPDRLVFLPAGRLYLVELKTDTGRVRPVQAAMHKRLRQLGFDVRVVRGMEEARAFVGEVCGGAVSSE